MTSPSPTSAPATLRPDLGTMNEFDLAMDRLGFVWNRLAPVIEVAEASGAFGKIPLKQLLETRDTRRAASGGYSRSSFQFEPDSYTTAEHGAEEPVSENLRRMYRNYFDAEDIARQRAFDVVLRNAEIRWVTIFNNTSVYSDDAVSTAWTDASSADPIGDVEGAVQAIWDATGIWPNTLVLSRKTFRTLRNCDQIIERINSEGAGDQTRPGDVTVQQLQAVFDLAKVVVAGSAKNEANKGQSASVASIWNDDRVLIARTADTNDIQEPCIARTMHWAEDGSQVGGTVEEYYEVQTRSDVIRVRHQVGEKRMYDAMGYILTGVNP